MYISQLREDSVKQQKGLDNLLRISDDLRRQIASINEKIEDIPSMRQSIIDQKVFIQDVAVKFHAHVSELADFIDKTNKSIDKVDQRCSNLHMNVKELEDFVNHYHEGLILPASQIRVETTAGFSDRPMTLIEVLGLCNVDFEHLREHTSRIDQRLINHDEELSKKAPESILFQVNSIERKVAAVEYVLQKEEDQGLSAVRRQCEQLTSDVQSITAELHDKIDKDAVSLIVHEKYDEIVRYLQDALQSSSEDEQNFKAKSDELQDMLFKLANSKCDRTEIIPMQEMLVKTEAMLRKLATDRPSPAVKDTKKEMILNTYTKKEVEAMLELKVDKETFEQQLQSMMKIAKKARRLSSVLSPTSGAGNIHDQASGYMMGAGSAMAGGLVLDTNHRDQMMWKSLADVAKDESDAALLKSQIVSKMNAGRQNVVSGRTTNPSSPTKPSKNPGAVAAGSSNPATSSNINSRSALNPVREQNQGNQGNPRASNNVGNSGNTAKSKSSRPSSTRQRTSSSQQADGSQSNKYNNGSEEIAVKQDFGGVVPISDSFHMMTDDIDFRTNSRGQPVDEQMYVDVTDSVDDINSLPRQMSSSPTHYIQGRSIQLHDPSSTRAAHDHSGMNIRSSDNDDDDERTQDYLIHPSSQQPIDVTIRRHSPSQRSQLNTAQDSTGTNPSIPVDRIVSSSNGGAQDLSYLGAHIAGGGFNLKTANITKPQSLKAASGFADGSQDLEATGL
jgi:hypothetical protein